MSETQQDIDGYFSETGYPSVFNRLFSPASIAGALQWSGYHSPPLRDGFCHLDLGCGDALGLCLIAAAHPEGQFVGVDAMASHIAIGRRFADQFNLTNIELRCETFAEFAHSDCAKNRRFDYITAQGVISWVSPDNRQRVFDIGKTCLAEEGCLTLGYNAQPGWQVKLSIQQLLLRIVGNKDDKSPQMLADTLDVIERLHEAGARSIDAKAVQSLRELTARLPHEYILHEYLNQHWQPLWFGEVQQALAQRSLGYACEAGFNRLRDDFCLRQSQRDELQGFSDPLERQTVRDIMQNNQFRTDIFINEAGRKKRKKKQSDTRQQVWFMANRAYSEVEFSCLTPAGRLRFDNAATHAILQQLELGPRPYIDLQNSLSFDNEDILNATETLMVAGLISAVAPPLPSEPNPELNHFLIAEAQKKSPNFLNGLVGRHGSVPAYRKIFKELVDSPTTEKATRRRLGLDNSRPSNAG